MRVLITGGTGFLGSHLSKRMAQDGHEVRLLARNTSRLRDGAAAPMTIVAGDVTNPAGLEAAIHGCDYVVHAAADLNYWRQDPDRQMKVNVEGTRNVARACRRAGVKRLVHVSSVAAIGIPTSPAHPANEDFPYNLDDPKLVYHASKRRAEEVLTGEVSQGLSALIVNPASITSPAHLARLIQNVRRNRIVPCFSGGNCVVHVADVVEGIVAACERGAIGERYILGGENLTFRRMGEKAAALLRLRRRFVEIPPVVTGLGAAICEPWARRRNRPPKFAYMIHYCANRFLYYDSGKALRELNYRARDFDAILTQALEPAARGPAVS